VGCASGTCAITSNPTNSTLYGALMGGLLLNTFQKENNNSENKKTQKMKTNKQTIVDVRTPGEFMGGHVVGSINIPLNELPDKVEEIKQLPQPIILCCASGGRSGQAEYFLSKLGIECINGGSWFQVNSLVQQ
jgi:rhodanese-related sulfurtransferase